MNRKILPIGSVVELKNGLKLIIIGYEMDGTYVCAGYPAYFLMDTIPLSKHKEFKNKYKFYNNDTNLDINGDYKVIYEGYKNDKFYEFEYKFQNIK